jgi:hypothetical protein
MRRLTTFTLGIAFTAVTLAACGDDSSSSDTTAASTTAVPSTTAAPATTPVDTAVTEETVGDDPVNSDAPGFGTEFCNVNQSLNDAASAAIDGDGTPEGLQAFFEVEFPAQFAEMSAVTPADLADDMVVLGDGFTALGALFAANEWNLEAAFNDPELNNVLDNQAYVDAGAAVEAYCGE